jgi:hypothetical protein
MQLEHLDELDELLRIIDRSGLCRADRGAFPDQGPRSIAIPISAKRKRFEDARLGQPAHGSEVLLPGH